MENLPLWLKRSPSNALWNLLNPPNILIDEAQEFINDTKYNMLPGTFNPGDRNPVYISIQQVADPSADYSSESGNISITVTNELEDFFYGVPTRIVGETGDARSIPEITRTPIDVHYIENMRLDSGDDDIYESGGSIVVLQENTYNDDDAFTFFNIKWGNITTSEVKQSTQDFSTQPSDEWVTPGDSGNLFYKLNKFPLKDTVVVRNVLGLDSWGNAQEIPTSFTESGRFIVFDEDILGSGMFIAEYDFIPDLVLRSFGPLNYRGLVGVQGNNPKFTESIILQPTNTVVMDPAIDMQLDPDVTHSLTSVKEMVPVNIDELGTNNTLFYLRFTPDQLRPGMEVVVDYKNEYGISRPYSLTAVKISNDYSTYMGTPTYKVGVDVTSLLPGDRSTFNIRNFKVSRYVDYASIISGMEIHVYDDGKISHTPHYALDRVGQYIEERSPESGGFVRRNLIGQSYATTDLPNLKVTHPTVQTALFNKAKLLDPTIPTSVPIAIRRWASWILLLRKTSSSTTPYSRFFQPTNQGETRAYQLVFIDIDTFEEYTTMDVTLGFEATSFTIDDDENIHIIGYTGLAKSDYATPHTISISSVLAITKPASTVHRYDVVDFTIDIDDALANVSIKHVPSDTLVYSSNASHSGQFTSEGWGTYRISGDYSGTVFNDTFEIEPTTNRRVMRQTLQFKYDYAIRVPIDDENEIVYFRERYKWGIDKDTTDA